MKVFRCSIRNKSGWLGWHTSGPTSHRRKRILLQASFYFYTFLKSQQVFFPGKFPLTIHTRGPRHHNNVDLRRTPLARRLSVLFTIFIGDRYLSLQRTYTQTRTRKTRNSEWTRRAGFFWNVLLKLCYIFECVLWSGWMRSKLYSVPGSALPSENALFKFLISLKRIFA